MSFKDDLQKEYLDHKERQKLAQEENQHKLEKETFEKFVKSFGVVPDSVDGQNATKDELTFHWDYNDFRAAWALVGRCPQCGKECRSYHYENKIGLLKEIFDKFRPSCHTCDSLDSDLSASESTEEKLIELLKNLIYENSYQG